MYIYICKIYIYIVYLFGQIIATSHDLTPNGGLSKGNPLISGKYRLVKYYYLARSILYT